MWNKMFFIWDLLAKILLVFLIFLYVFYVGFLVFLVLSIQKPLSYFHNQFIQNSLNIHKNSDDSFQENGRLESRLLDDESSSSKKLLMYSSQRCGDCVFACVGWVRKLWSRNVEVLIIDDESGVFEGCGGFWGF